MVILTCFFTYYDVEEGEWGNISLWDWKNKYL